jgi:nucleoid-associated protein YgaU
MRRIVPVVTFGLLSVCISGCGLFGKKNKDAVAADPYYADPSYAGGSSVPSMNSTYPSYSDASLTSAGGKTHTVQRKETLFSIARMHYNGDASKWRTIYDANRAEIGDDPNKIRVGQRLVIP